MQKRINKIKLKISQSLTKKKKKILLCSINSIKFPSIVSLSLLLTNMLDNNRIQDFIRAKLLKHLLSITRPSTCIDKERSTSLEKEIVEGDPIWSSMRNDQLPFIVNSNIALLMGFPGRIECYFLLFIEGG